MAAAKKKAAAKRTTKAQTVTDDPVVTSNPVTYKAGYVVLSTAHASGGVRYEREQIDRKEIGEGEESRTIVDKKVDNLYVLKEGDRIVKRADYLIKRACVNLGFGWFADQGTLDTLRKEFAELKEAAASVNQVASVQRSLRRVHVGLVAGKLVLDSEAADELARVVTDALTRIKDALRAGSVRDVTLPDGVISRDQSRVAMNAAQGLDRLATGISRDQIVLALSAAKVVRNQIAEAIDNGKKPADAGAAADLETIEAAISWFNGPSMFGGGDDDE